MQNEEAPGPRATYPTPALATPAQQAVFDHLAGLDEPVTVAEIAHRLGQHRNTVREHVDALLAAGLLEQHEPRAHARGRPAARYAVRPGGGAPFPQSALLEALVRRLETEPDGARVARALGRQAAPVTDDDSPTLTEHLRAWGLTPRAEAGQQQVRLTTCPLRDLADGRPDAVVCAFHQGVLDVLARGSHPELTPFAEPGACLLSLSPPTR